MLFRFFATSEEVYDLWDCIGDLPGMQLLEADSRPDQANRNFEKFPRSEWIADNRNFTVVAWASDIGESPRARSVVFRPDSAKKLGAVGRTSLISPAFFRIGCVSAPNDNLIAPCELIYWTEKIAAKSLRFDTDQLEEIDWKALSQRVTTIKRLIVARSVGNWRSAPVSHEIAEKLKTTGARLWLWGPIGTI